MITVIGLDGGPLGRVAEVALAEAACVVGARRHLDAVPVPPGARRVPLAGLALALDEALAAEGPTVLLASGDPGFLGVVRALRAKGADPRVVPAVSSVATAFARIGVPWDDAVVVSAHGRAGDGRSPHRALAAALAHPKAAILTAPATAEPDTFLPDLLHAGRDVYVAQRLGTPDEAVTRVTDEHVSGTWAHPNVVLAIDPPRAVAPAMTWMTGHAGAPDGWALPEDAFAHRDSMVTKPEVRATALARLAPRPGTVVWDVGAGSGSVAVECARFGAHAVAFERNAGDCQRIRRNAETHGVRVEVCRGEATDILRDPGGLLGPDAVFCGGGGTGVLAAALRHGPTRAVVALAAVDRVRAAYDLLAQAGYAVSGTQLQASSLSPLPDGSLRLAAANPVTLVWGVLPTQEDTMEEERR